MLEVNFTRISILAHLSFRHVGASSCQFVLLAPGHTRWLPWTSLLQDGTRRFLTSPSMVQVIWVENLQSSSGLTRSRKAMLARSQQKETAGKLMSQLYDRNSRQAFAPREAFHDGRVPTDQITAQLQSELSSQLRRPAVSQSRVWSLLRYASAMLPSLPLWVSILVIWVILSMYSRHP